MPLLEHRSARVAKTIEGIKKHMQKETRPKHELHELSAWAEADHRQKTYTKVATDTQELVFRQFELLASQDQTGNWLEVVIWSPSGHLLPGFVQVKRNYPTLNESGLPVTARAAMVGYVMPIDLKAIQTETHQRLSQTDLQLLVVSKVAPHGFLASLDSSGDDCGESLHDFTHGLPLMTTALEVGQHQLEISGWEATNTSLGISSIGEVSHSLHASTESNNQLISQTASGTGALGVPMQPFVFWNLANKQQAAHQVFLVSEKGELQTLKVDAQLANSALRLGTAIQTLPTVGEIVVEKTLSAAQTDATFDELRQVISHN